MTNSIQDLISKVIDDEDKEARSTLLQKLKEEETIWVATCPYSKNYSLEYVKAVPCASIFSQKSFFEEYQQECKEQNIEVNCIENEAKDRMVLLSDLYRSGFEGLIVDKGQKAVHLSLFALMEKPDFSKLPEIQRPVMNPSLIRATNELFEAAGMKTATIDQQNRFFQEIKKAQFLMPMDGSQMDLGDADSNGKTVVKKDSKISLPLIRNSEDQHFNPVFTDWNEFRKYDPDKKYNGMLVDLDDIKNFIKESDGAVINPFGANVILSEELIKEIEAVPDSEAQ